MNTSLKAHVRNGRLKLDEPTELPEGTEVDLVPADTWDALEEEDRRRLHEALHASQDDFENGRLLSARELVAELRRAAR